MKKLSHIVFIRTPALSIVSEQFLCTFSFVTYGSYSLPYIRFDIFPTRCNFTQFIYF